MYYCQLVITSLFSLSLSLSLSSVFCCRAGSEYSNGYPVLGNSWGGFPFPSSFFHHIVIRVFLLLGTVCPWHPPYLVLLSRAFPYLQPGDAGGRRSASAVCQSLTSAQLVWFSVSMAVIVKTLPFVKTKTVSIISVKILQKCFNYVNEREYWILVFLMKMLLRCFTGRDTAMMK